VTAQPSTLGSIRNFAWVEPGRVARGEQPVLDDWVFEALASVGIRGMLSLRPDGETPPVGGRRPWPDYHVDHERRLALAHGMRFRHAPLQDFSAAPPAELAAALAALDEEVAAGPAVYVHCRAGAGRAGLITAAWSIASGGSGDDAARTYARFMHHIIVAAGYADLERADMLRRVGQPQVLWALEQIAAALGSPVTCDLDLLPPAPPAECDGWAEMYHEVLRPWREARGLRVVHQL
jgi:protein tyrosine phosphatase (PTP) superfamily phosphohydrolase (DUF442 family)